MIKQSQSTQNIRTRTHTYQLNSNRTSRHHDGHTNTETSVLLFAWANEGDRSRLASGHLPQYYLFTGRSQILKRIIAGRIILAHYSENKYTLQNVVNMRLRCMTSIFFLLELRKSIILLRGIQSFKTMDTEGASTNWQESIHFIEHSCSRIG